MARIAGVNIPQNKLVIIGLTYIFGIGEKNSNDICKSLDIPSNKRVYSSKIYCRGWLKKRNIT